MPSVTEVESLSLGVFGTVELFQKEVCAKAWTQTKRNDTVEILCKDIFFTFDVRINPLIGKKYNEL